MNKKVLAFVAVIACIVITVIVALCFTIKVDYDAILICEAEEFVNTYYADLYDSESNPFIAGTWYCTVEQEDNTFYINTGGTESEITYEIVIEDNYTKENISDITDSDMLKIIKSAKKLVKKYIKHSSILNEKTEIEEYIDSISVVMAEVDKEHRNIVAAFNHDEETIYITKDSDFEICEWTLVHEYIHAISYYTHGKNTDDVAYQFYLFDEAMTDLITKSMDPDMTYTSGYASTYCYVYPYINLFGEDAVYAYFYGYDEIYERIGTEEMNLYTTVLQNPEEYGVIFKNLIYKWYAEYATQ